MRVGIAGFGFGRRHAEVVYRLPDVELIIAEPDAERRRQAEAQFPDASVMSDGGSLITDGGLDCVLIVSASHTHAELSRTAITAGVPVFSEKPLALTIDEARSLRDLARERNVIYQAGYILRYETRHQMLFEEIRERRSVGDVRLITSKRNCSRSWFEAWGRHSHPVWEAMVHDIDLILWLTGQRCIRVSAWAQTTLGGPAPETFVACLEMEYGALALLQSSWLVPRGAPKNISGASDAPDTAAGTVDAHLDVLGSEGSAGLSWYEPSLTVTTDSEVLVPDHGMFPITGSGVGGALRDEIVDFIAQVRGEVDSTVASIDDAVQVQAIAEALLRAAESGEAIVIEA